MMAVKPPVGKSIDTSASARTAASPSPKVRLKCTADTMIGVKVTPVASRVDSARRTGDIRAVTQYLTALNADSDLDEPVLEGVFNELGARRSPKLLLDVRAVRLDRAGGEEQSLCDLGVGVPEGDQAQDLELAHREVVWRSERRRRSGGELCAEPRVEVALARR